MSAEIFPRPYTILSPGGTVFPRPYMVFNMQNRVTQAHAYAVNSTGSGAEAGLGIHQAYAVVVNPATLTANRLYTTIRHDQHIPVVRGYVVMQTIYPPYETLNIEYPFSENRFPESVSYGSSGGPGFKTSVFGVDSGIVNTSAEWDRLRAKYDVTFDACPKEDIEKVEEFFYAMRGRAIGFRFKDWSDYQIVNQNVVVGDGGTVEFQLFKRYRSGGNTFDRMIKKPVVESAGSLWVDGTEFILNRDYYINSATGILSFNEPLPSGAVGNLEYCEFDVPVRFDTDTLKTSAEDFNQYSISNLEMIEILV